MNFPRMHTPALPTRSPDGEGGAPPAPPPATGSQTADPSPPSPEPPAEPKPEGSHEAAPNPADPPADPAAEPKPDPAKTPEEIAAEAARAVKPTEASGYELILSDKAKEALGDMTDDPALGAMRNAALAKGWTQGEFNDRFGQAVEALADAGLLVPNFNPAAELAALGDNGAARQQEVEMFAKQLQTRGELTEAEAAELTSLAPTAAGVTLVEKLRKMMGDAGMIVAPAAADPKFPNDTPDQIEARAMARDPRYETDKAFRKEADAKFMAAFSRG